MTKFFLGAISVLLFFIFISFFNLHSHNILFVCEM